MRPTTEDLATVNRRLREQVEELTRANAELTNLIASTEMGTLFLDRHLALKRFTPRATDLFHVLPDDLGQPFCQLAHRVQTDALADAAQRVLESLATEEMEVERDDGRHYTARLNPFGTVGDRADGVVLTFTDVTELRDAADDAARRAAQQAAVADLERSALGGAAPAALFDQACTHLIDVLGAEVSQVLRHRPSESDLILEAGVGCREGLVGAATVSDQEHSLAGYTLLTDVVVIVPDADAESRFSVPSLLTAHGVRSSLSVPIDGPEGTPWGMLSVHSRTPNTFSSDDAPFIQSVAHVLCDALRRVRNEATIREQLAEIEAVYDTAPIGLAFYDRDLRFRRINGRLADINGAPVDAHIGKTIRDVLPGLADQIEPVLQSVLESGEPVLDLEITRILPSSLDARRDWLCSYVPEIVDGEVLGVSAVVRDITDRKRVETERAQALADLDFVLAAADIGVWSLDVATQRYRLDDRTLAVTGFGRPLTPDAALARVHPDDTVKIEDALRSAVDACPDTPALRFDARLIGDDDAIRWVEVRGQFLPDRGDAGTLFGIVYDTTLLHQATAQARQRLAEIEAYFDAVPLTVSVLDPEGHFLRVNAQLERFAGRSADALVGQRAEVLFPGLAAFVEPLIERVLAMSEPQLGIQVQVATPADPETPRDWLLYVQPVIDGGEAVAVVVASQDITELTHAQEDLRALTADLETRVAERTAQVRSLAADLTRAQDTERQRLALILHDNIQQLLYGAQAKLAALRRADADTADSLADQVNDALAQAVQICRTLSVDLSPPILSEEGVTRALAWVAHRFYDAHGLTVTVTGDEHVALDPTLQTLLARVVRELLFNVVKHSGVDAVTVYVAADSGTACVEVIDEGTGFSPDSASPGFGLSSSRDRLALAGGTFEVTSEPGAGTHVTICLPLCTATQ